VLTRGQDLRGWLFGHVGRALLGIITGTSVVAVLLIFVFILREAWPFFAERGLKDFGSTQWYPKVPEGVPASSADFGMLSLIFGSLYVTAGALLIAVPVGVLTAVVLSDIVPFRVRQMVKPIVEILASVPSVAMGFVAVLVLAPLMQERLNLTTGTNALNSMIMLAIMAVPTIVSVAEDSLHAAGRELREASYACGATRAETIIKVVIPAAHNGIIAAIVLGMMRAVGETMLVWMASGNAARIPTPWWDFTQSVRTLTATIAGEMGETARGTTHYYALFAVGAVLLVVSLLLNLATEYLLHRARKGAGGRA
jgi:phosphate transport system permease protein